MLLCELADNTWDIHKDLKEEVAREIQALPLLGWDSVSM
jgi:hypothetical protein